MRLQFKLSILWFLVIATLMTFVGYVDTSLIGNLTQEIRYISTNVDPLDLAAGNLQVAFSDKIRTLEEFGNNFENEEEANAQLAVADSVIEHSLKTLSSPIASSIIAHDNAAHLNDLYAKVKVNGEKLFSLKNPENLKADLKAPELYIPPSPEVRTILESLDDLVVQVAKLNADLRGEIQTFKTNRLARIEENTSQTATTITIISFLVSIILLLVIWFLTSKVVVQPLVELQSVAEVVAKGDLSRRARVNEPDEIGRVAKAFNIMVDSLLEAQRLPESIYRSMKDCLFVVGHDGNISDVNPGALETLGYNKEDLIGKPLATVFQKKPRAKIKSQE